MPVHKSPSNGQEWMLSLSAEGWAWEFLRRNADYRKDFASVASDGDERGQDGALKWGLLKFVDPSIDARLAEIFWTPSANPSVLPLVAQRGKRKNALSSVTCTRSQIAYAATGQRHILFSCCGRYLQLAITGYLDDSSANYLVDPLPESSPDRRILSLRKLSDLAQHKRLRAHLYVRQRRGPRFAHLAMVIDAHQRDPTHRAIARAIYGADIAERDWDNLRDHVRRAIAAGKKLTQGGYLRLLA